MHLFKRAGRFHLLALMAAIAAGILAVSLSFGSSHREAPGTMLDPSADDTDVYAFTADDAPGALTVVANWIPFEDGAGGPNFYRFDDRAEYYINVDNTGDGKYDVRYQFKFKTHYRNKSSFLYALPGVTSLGDKKLQVLQTYKVTRETYKNGRLRSTKVVARNLPVAPNNVGPKTFPNYGAVANQAIKSLPGGGKVFAGQREDPFFVDLGTTFDAINLRKGTGNEGGGKDDLAGYNVHSVVLQVPEAKVTRDGKSVSGPAAKNAVIGVWSSTERPRLQVNGANTVSGGRQGQGGDVQVSRLGNPLVNEVVIPVGLKDKFNATQPSDDAKNFGKYVVKPELAGVINALFNLGVKTTDRTDIVDALLVGLPGKTKIAPNAVPADTLKLNLGVPPTATPNRFGVIAGDLGGFPNGRRLADDVTDIELRVIGGFLVPADKGGKQLPLGDGVDRNDVPFLTSFPYAAPPTNGFNSSLKRVEPDHAPTPGNLMPAAP
jgi:hypothetical protein